jgi:hypothetical protein
MAARGAVKASPEDSFDSDATNSKARIRAGALYEQLLE